MNLLAGAMTFCKDTKPIWVLVGKILWIFKIVIPILVIIFGMVDLGKAVVASKDDEIKKAAKSLMFRALAGILIFFIPTIIMFVFRIISEFNTIEQDLQFDVCEACILKPNSSKCTDQILEEDDAVEM